MTRAIRTGQKSRGLSGDPFNDIEVLAMQLVASVLLASIHANAPAAGGLPGVAVSIDAPAGVLHVKRDGAADKAIPIPIDRARIDVAASAVEVVNVGEGRRVVHARIPDSGRKDLAFEVVVSGQSDEPIFAGLTGYTRGSEGDRAGDVVLLYDREGGSKFVIVAETREDTRICGQATTPVGARGLDPKTMQLRGAALPRIDKKARDGAARVVAQVRAADAKPPLGRVLFATGGSSANAAALTDGKLDTVWTEERSGDGHGEFATMRAPSEVPIHALSVTISPPAPKATGAAPKTFFVATDDKLFHVTMPEDAWSKPGQAYEIALPAPVKTTCVAVVLDEAYARGHAPEVSIAEVSAITRFDADGATLDDVAKELSGPRVEEAAALLRRSGDDGLAAVAKRWDELDARARAFGVDVASSAGNCDGAAGDLLTRALADREAEVKRRAMGRLERCGKNAGDALAKAVRSDDEARRAAAAPLLATVAPAIALDPLSEQLGKGKPETRRAVRGAFARASASSSRDKLLALVMRKDLEPVARLDLLRAMGQKLPELRPESDAALADVLRGTPDMATRYLVAAPLAQLARSPDAKPGELTRLAELARRDPEWPVRARAVELAAGIAPLVPTVIEAASDPAPRVREAAFRAIGSARLPSGVPQAARVLAEDPWTFVRVAAADALGALPQDGSAQSALAGALGDGSPKVRVAAIQALAKQHATGQASRIRERLDDTKEDVEVRAAAARALGAMCVQNAADRLTKLALLARSPVDAADEQIGMAAIDALSMLHPRDLDRRLGPLRGKEARPPLRRAVERALAEPGVCR